MDNVIEGEGTFKDNGPTNNEWRNVFVYGHDGNHYAFYTCNSWTGRALREAGVETGLWTPLSQSIMWRLD